MINKDNILATMNQIMLYCKDNDIMLELKDDYPTFMPPENYVEGDLRIADEWVVWRYKYNGFISDTKILLLLDDFNMDEYDFIAYVLDCTSFYQDKSESVKHSFLRW